MIDLPSATLTTVQERLRTATLPYKALLADTGPIVERVIDALAEVDAIQKGDVNPHFLNRMSCEILHRHLRDERIVTTTEEPAPLAHLAPEQQVVSFLEALGYNIKQTSDLLSWSPRKTKNLLHGAEKSLALAKDRQVITEQLRFATEDQSRDNCPSSVHLWCCAHGDEESENIIKAALHSVRCGHCTELWLLAWAIEPELNDSPLLARSVTEDMREQEPETLNGPALIDEVYASDTPETQPWMVAVAITGVGLLIAMAALIAWPT